MNTLKVLTSQDKEFIWKNNLRFVLDYLVNCNKGSSVVYQIGDGAADHKWWGPVEVIERKWNVLILPAEALL